MFPGFCFNGLLTVKTQMKTYREQRWFSLDVVYKWRFPRDWKLLWWFSLFMLFPPLFMWRVLPGDESHDGWISDKKYGYIAVGEQQFRRLAEQKCLEAKQNVSEFTGIESWEFEASLTVYCALSLSYYIWATCFILEQYAKMDKYTLNVGSAFSSVD